MSKKNVYIVGDFEDQHDWSDLISRLTWYFTPYLGQIDRIEVTATPAQIEAAELVGPLDPLIAEHMPALKARLISATAGEIRGRLKRVDPKKHLFLLADEALEAEYNSEIGRFRPRGRFYKIDPHKTRMEGSFYLWAGINSFVDQKKDIQEYHARFKLMHEDLGQYEKAYVFGTGPSLGDFVEGHDFSDGLCIISNSIVKNDDLLDKLKPRAIVAADPIFHAGCSSYAAAFRTSLVKALDKTGAWFLCPMRDVKIYATYLPEHLQERIIGIGFNNKAEPPTDLLTQFELKPYPNILTLMLLPMASTFAKSIHIAGCDGRRITDDGAFWTHDKKAQFVDEMDNIKRVHPGFFAIDYNDYYLDHARDLERVLATLEDAGKTCVNECRSFIPALTHRERPGLRRPVEDPDRPLDPRTVAILDPDARGDWGHFLAYDRRFGIALVEKGCDFAIIGRADLDQAARPKEARTLVNAYTQHSWTIGNKWPKVETRYLSAFAFETEKALVQLEDEQPDGDILIFMYCGSIEVVEMLEHILVYHPRVRAVINLFWSYNFDMSNPAYQERYLPTLRRVMSRPGRVRVMHSTPQISAEFKRDVDLDIPVLPHPSTTFSDAQAQILSRRPSVDALRTARPRILFPGGARSEKGYLLSAQVCELLSQNDDYHLILRTRLDATTEAPLRAAVDRLDPARVRLEDGDFPQDAFVNWLAAADVIVVPYLPSAFSNRTSGMLVDAMLLGVPVVVINETWLADEVAESQAGLSVDPTPEAMIEGIKTVLANYGRFSATTRSAAANYVQRSTWSVLVDRVLATAGLRTAQPALLPKLCAYLPGEARLDIDIATEQLQEHLAASQDIHVAIYTDPRLRLVQAILDRQDPSALLADWRESARALIDLFRKNRRKLRLVERDAVLGNRAFLDEVLPAEVALDAIPAHDTTESVNPLLFLLADLYFGQDRANRKLLNELVASSLTPEDQEAAPVAELDRAMAHFQELTGAYYKTGILEMKGEALDARIQILSDHVADLEKDLGDVCQEVSEKSKAVQFKTQQLTQLQSTVEMYFKEADALRLQLDDMHKVFHEKEEDLRNLQEVSDDFHSELNRVYESRSWRVTHPLRVLSEKVRLR